MSSRVFIWVLDGTGRALQRAQNRFALFGGKAGAAAADDEELVVDRNHPPQLIRGGHQMARGGEGFCFLQATALNFAQFHGGSSEEQVADAAQRKPLSLKEPDRRQLQKMLFPITRTSAFRRIDTAGGALDSDITL